MRVAVDEAGKHRLALTVDDLGPRKSTQDVVARAHGRDAVAVHGQGAAVVNGAAGVAGHDRRVADHGQARHGHAENHRRSGPSLQDPSACAKMRA
jgi:hypothetical protein